MQKKIPLPKVGLFTCFSGGSNTGTLTGLAALEVVRRLGKEAIGICSLPAVLNEVPRQSTLVQQLAGLIVVDGCHQECARHLLLEKGIKPDVYLNLEKDLQLAKQGPFTSLEYTAEQVQWVTEFLIGIISEKFHLSEKPKEIKQNSC